MSATIEAREVTVSIDGQLLLRPTSFSVRAGRVLAVRGQNGSGKTTLLRVLAGLTEASSGTVSLSGRPVDERNRHFRRSLAALIGPPAFARELTLREQMRFVAASWGATSDEADASADELLDALAIAPLAERFGHELSSGQLQMASLALILSRPCEVLVLDEPEQRLDGERRALVANVLKGAVDRGVTIVFASHDAALIERLADESIDLGDAGP